MPLSLAPVTNTLSPCLFQFFPLQLIFKTFCYAYDRLFKSAYKVGYIFSDLCTHSGVGSPWRTQQTACQGGRPTYASPVDPHSVSLPRTAIFSPPRQNPYILRLYADPFFFFSVCAQIGTPLPIRAICGSALLDFCASPVLRMAAFSPCLSAPPH